MRNWSTIGTILATGLTLAACARHDGGTSSSGQIAQQSTLAKASGAKPVPAVPAAGRARFAALPDRGELLRYDAQAPVREGAYTWHRAELSEQHALTRL